MGAESNAAGGTAARPSWWTFPVSLAGCLLLLIVLLVFAMSQSFGFMVSSTPFDTELYGWPAICWVHHRTYSFNLGLNSPGRVLETDVSAPSLFGCLLNTTFLAAIWILIILFDRGERSRQFTVRTLFVLMFCAALLLGSYQLAQTHNAFLNQQLGIPTFP